MAATAALGGLPFGYDTGIISGALLFIREDLNLSDAAQQTVVGSLLFGAELMRRAGHRARTPAYPGVATSF